VDVFSSNCKCSTRNVLSEFGQNQYEITCHPTDPLTAADKTVNIREITRNAEFICILASCLEIQFDTIKQSMETFLLHNEYLLNRIDKLCLENIFEQSFQATLSNNKK
jgi:hypothetical protein